MNRATPTRSAFWAPGLSADSRVDGRHERRRLPVRGGADGRWLHWQGLKVNGNLNITKYQPGMGLRQVTGNDPANPTTDYFSLGQGSPQVWEPNVYAAGTAACEIRIVKSTTIQPSTPDQHQMTVPDRLRDVGLDVGLRAATARRSGA
jgi:hypothetical protein